MKSLFKRTLAAASSSILVLSQLSAVAANVNISAAGTDSEIKFPIVVDKESVLFVPINEEDPLIGLHSDWNDKAEAALLAAGDKTFTVSLDRGKKYAKKAMLKSDRIDSATADDILAAVSNATVTVNSDGKGKAEFEIADLGKIAGSLIEQEMRDKNGGKDVTLGGKPVVVDWSKLTLTCKALVEAETDFDAKTVSYKVTLTDENGKTYTDYKAVEKYVLAKVDEAAQLLKDSAAKNGGNIAKFNAKVDEYVGKAKSGEGYIAKMVEAVNAITASASDLDTLYTDYSDKLVEAAKGVGAPAYYTNKAVNKFESEKPATVSQFWTDERTQDAYDAAVELIKDNYSEYVDVQLKLSDIQSIVEGANSAEYSINGYSGKAVLNIDDDKADEVAQAIRDKYEAKWLAEGYTIKEIKSSKKITAEGKSEYGMTGSAFFDVERIIEVVTDTTPAVTTTTAEPSQSTTTTTVTTPVSGSETTPVEGSETTPVGSESTPAPVTETTPVPGSETTPVGSETTPVPVTETTPVTTPEPTTSTTAATYVSFEFEGIQKEGLVYWSEEDTAFDLSNLSISLHFYEGGIEQVLKTKNVTDAFKPTATKANELVMPEKTGMTTKSVYFKLTDEDAVKQAILDAGYDEALIEAAGIQNGLEAGKFDVHLVLRGDGNLDGSVDVADAQLALFYYVNTRVALREAEKNMDQPIYENCFGSKEYAEAYFPFSHYAMDVEADENGRNDGEVTVEDAQRILKYYTHITVAQKEGLNWDSAEVVGKKVTPLDDLHKDPCGRDDWAASFRGKLNAPKQED